MSVSDELSEGIKRRTRNGALKADYATEQIIEQHKHIMEIIESGRYINVDESLVLPGAPKFLLTLKKTLYRGFISSIAQRVKEEVQAGSKNGKQVMDGYLAPMMEKLAESTDTAANMDSSLRNATSILRKGRILIASGIETIEDLIVQGKDYQRLQMAVIYLYRNLADSIDKNYRFLAEKFDQDTNWEFDFKAFGVMKEKMDDLERRITPMNGPNWVRERIKDIGNMFGVKELKLGRVHFTL